MADRQPHPLAELLFVAERIDLAHVQDGPTPTEEWWEQGHLTGDRAVLDAMLNSAEQTRTHRALARRATLS